MTPRERSAFNAGVEAMRQMAMTAAVTIEIRDDASRLRQQAAIAALQGLADGARALMLQATSTPERCISVVVYNDLEAETGRETPP